MTTMTQDSKLNSQVDHPNVFGAHVYDVYVRYMAIVTIEAL